MSHAALEQRLARELEHFQEHYAHEAAQGIEPLSDFDLRRYAAPPADTMFAREYFYHLLGPIAGLHTLEIACGNGIDACLCAARGARVHAYDLAEQSVEMVRRRAKASGLADRVKTQVCGDFMSAFAGQSFDRIMGYAALHHLPMQGLAEQIRGRLRPGGRAVFAEPVVNSRALRALRDCIPFAFSPPTQDEQPLNDAMIADFAKPFGSLVRREFHAVARLWPLVAHNWTLTCALHRLDHWLLKLPLMRRFATVVVFAVER